MSRSYICRWGGGTSPVWLRRTVLFDSLMTSPTAPVEACSSGGTDMEPIRAFPTPLFFHNFLPDKSHPKTRMIFGTIG